MPQAASISRRQAPSGTAAAALAVAAPSWARLAADATRSGRDSRPDRRVVIVGAGLAGLGCAFRFWHAHGIRSVVYEANPVRAGGRVHTLHGFFAGGQYTEQHGEFISSEHTQMRKLAAAFHLALDNVNRYPPHTRAADYRLRFGDRFWSQAALDRDWRKWARELFLHAATKKAPWPTLYNKHTAWARRWDHMSAAEWIDRHIPGGLGSDFGRLCVADGVVQGAWDTTIGQAGERGILISLPGGAEGADIGRKYRLAADAGPAPAAMARGFLHGFEIAFPGPRPPTTGAPITRGLLAIRSPGERIPISRSASTPRSTGSRAAGTGICTSPASRPRLTSRASWKGRCAAVTGARVRSPDAEYRYPRQDPPLHVTVCDAELNVHSDLFLGVFRIWRWTSCAGSGRSWREPALSRPLGS